MQRLAPAGTRLRAGAGVARGRVYLLDSSYQRGAIDLRRALETEGYEVLPTQSDTLGGGRDPTEIASAGCVVVLLDQHTVDSRDVRSALAYAQELAKPVIPVVLDPDVQLPLSLASTVPLNWFEGQPEPEVRAMMLDAIRATVGRVQTPPIPPGSAAGARPVFISYASADRAAALDLAGALEHHGTEVWIDQYLTPGADWLQSQERALSEASAVVVMVSPAQLASRSSQQEVAFAAKIGTPILPIVLGTSEVPPWLDDRVALYATDEPIDAIARRVTQSLRLLADEPQ
jgi:hypothetical protein